MADAALASHLQQWAFAAPPACSHAEPGSRRESLALQDRYLSSEEELSPVDDGSESEPEPLGDDDDVVVHNAVSASLGRSLSVSRWNKGRRCDMAVMVSYAFAGRPKVVTVPNKPPTNEDGRSDASSFTTAVSSRSVSPSSGRNGSQPAPTPATALASGLASVPAPASVPVPAPAPAPVPALAPAPAAAFMAAATQPPASGRSSNRSSLYGPDFVRNTPSRLSTTRSSLRNAPLASSAPDSPSVHAFLSSDPYETSTTSAASPIIKPSAHKRLRSISMKLALAKIAITPSKKPYDARVNGRVSQTTPSTPATPRTAPLEPLPLTMASPNKLRRASTILRPKSRAAELSRGPSPEAPPPMPSATASSAFAHGRLNRMIARGAGEREPTLVIPPCPDTDDDESIASISSKRLRKRKSLLDLLGS